MSKEKKVGKGVIRVVIDDITMLEVDAMVFYARPELQLGTGVGNAISVRGGGKIQEELNAIGSAAVGDAVVTSGGKLKVEHIIHAVGPAFQEQGMEDKLRSTMAASLKLATEKGAKKIAVPPMGTGFYGVPRDMSARVMVQEIASCLAGETSLEEVVICVVDPWNAGPIEAELGSAG